MPSESCDKDCLDEYESLKDQLAEAEKRIKNLEKCLDDVLGQADQISEDIGRVL